jgi:enterochelin esterase-like enzyme
MTGWTPVEMKAISRNVFSVFIPGANSLQPYKYLSGPAWNYTEVNKQGYHLNNRSYKESDTVEKWAITWNYENNIIPKTSSGTINRIWFRSNLVDDRYVDIWLPDNYNEKYKHNVLYMHDGQMLFDPMNWNRQEWNADSTLSILMAKGSIQKTIVVGIHNNGWKRHAEFFPSKVIDLIPGKSKDQLLKLFNGGTGADDYLKFIVKELKPFIDSAYSTNPDRRHTFIAGSSMGGLISLYAFCEYPEIFSGAACLSTHWTGVFYSNHEIPDAINQWLLAHLPAPKGRRIYFDHGTKGLDTLYKFHQDKIDRTLRKKGYKPANWKSLEFRGADHDENSWRRRFYIPATFLLSGRQTE